ncbi:MAG: hypothetical protein M0Z32_08575 [Actinomycetota bacterium]|nr:hypothetical protein [Actinomycetota bacterium]MCL6093744.1 hypothetical protein [Actinomycetota bacterium]MDA8167780.1 hypothetical protein [Actinomycetota bacterium]
MQGKPAQATLASWYSSAAPQLGVAAASISWGSLDNYQQGRLDVAFNVVNNGNGTAYRVVYHVPAGTLAFKTLVTLSCVDASGRLLGFSR